MNLYNKHRTAMIKKIYLVSVNMVKDNTPINSNVDDNLITTAIFDAQQINVQQICGTKLYKKILALVDSDEIQLPENSRYKTLLDEYIQPVVISWAYVYSIPVIHTKVMNVGVVNQNSDNSISADIKETQFLLDDARNKAQFYSDMMTRFLIANTKELYPEYLENKRIDETKPTIHQYTNGLVLDDIYPNRPHYNIFPVYL